MAEDSVAQDQIKAFVDRILRLKDESKAIASGIREIYAEAKGNGFDKTVLGKLVNYVEKRQSNSADLEEGEALFDLYLSAYDGAKRSVGTVRATHTHASEETDPDADEVAAVKARLAALKSNPAMAVVNAADIKKSPSQPAPQAGSDLTNPAPLNGQVASIQEPTAPKSAPDSDDTTVSLVETAAEAKTVDQEPSEVSGSGEVQDESAIHLATNCQPGKSVEAPASAAPAPLYPDPGEIYWENTPREPVHRHEYSVAFGDFGQDPHVIAEDISKAQAEPIVMIGSSILDGWARYNCARCTVGLDGQTAHYPAVQYDGTDPLVDCIRWNMAGRILTECQKRAIVQRLVRIEPKRKADIFKAMDMGMELVA